MTYRNLKSAGAVRLERAGIEEAENDALELLTDLKDWSSTAYLLHADEEITEAEAAAYEKRLKRRTAHEPLQHITGKAWFYGYEFSVGPDVLIPRFDTEILVEEALKVLYRGAVVLDLCTGSGCIAAALKLERNDLNVTGSDISAAALETAEKNASRLGADVRFIRSDLFGNIDFKADMIVSNPPYIETEEIETLSEEVRDHDPRAALDGGADGLDFYRAIVQEAPDHLVSGGLLLFEIGCTQGEAVTALLHKRGFRETETVRDLAGKPRVVKGTWYV